MRLVSKLVVGAIAVAFAFTALMSGEISPQKPGSNPSFDQALLNEDRPLLFVRNYVEAIQDQASREDYEAFLHPDLLKNAANMPDVFDQLYQNALSENAILGRANALTFSVRIEQSPSGRATVFFNLPETLPLAEVYPHSPFVGQGYVSDSGQINLARHEGHWRIVGHALDATEVETPGSRAFTFQNGMQ